jgi:hypothetical protein
MDYAISAHRQPVPERSAPLNEAFVAVTKRLEAGELAQGPANLQFLTRCL